jgi:hypothetical protein
VYVHREKTPLVECKKNLLAFWKWLLLPAFCLFLVKPDIFIYIFPSDLCLGIMWNQKWGCSSCSIKHHWQRHYWMKLGSTPLSPCMGPYFGNDLTPLCLLYLVKLKCWKSS